MILAFLALAWLLGIVAAAYTGGEPAATVAAAGLLGAITFAIRPRAATLAAIAAGVGIVLLAGSRYEDTIPTTAPNAIERLNDGDEVQIGRAHV